MRFGNGDRGDRTPHMMLMALGYEQIVRPMEIVAYERGYFLAGTRSRAAAPQPLMCHLPTAPAPAKLSMVASTTALERMAGSRHGCYGNVPGIVRGEAENDRAKWM